MSPIQKQRNKIKKLENGPKIDQQPKGNCFKIDFVFLFVLQTKPIVGKSFDLGVGGQRGGRVADSFERITHAAHTNKPT